MGAGDAPPSALGELVRRRRTAARLSLRVAAGRIGISPSYLLAIEHARNPTTGRPPLPSVAILAAIGRELDVPLETLVATAGIRADAPAHALLVSCGEPAPPALHAARALFGERVDRWVDVPAPAGDAFDPGAVLDALAAAVRAPAPRRLGVLFGARARRLGAVRNPARMIASEATWAADVTARLGRPPVANVCVYAQADLAGLAPRLDPLGATVRLLEGHDLVALQHADGRVEVGPAATEAILAAVRPADVDDDAWRRLARAAASGLARDGGGAG